MTDIDFIQDYYDNVDKETEERDWVLVITKVRDKDSDDYNNEREKLLEEILEWCESLEGKYAIVNGGIKFELEEDAVLYKVTWQQR